MAAEFAVSTVVEKLTNWITQEALLLEGVSDKVEQLRDDLQWMQSFLEDADAEQEKSQRFRKWVSQIREVAQQVEDVIETYIAEASSQSSWNVAAKLINRHKIGKEIERIQSRVQNISSQKEHFGISSTKGLEERKTRIANERLRWWRQPSPDIVNDNDLVGLVEDTKALISQLSRQEHRRCVVSIVGMGGLGKTTLAKRLYNHPDIKSEFDCKSFVYISQEYNRRDTLQRILGDTCPSEIYHKENLKEEELVTKLHKVLKERKYLVVLDDIWEKHVWDSMEAAFPSGKTGSKVMLTTRIRELALHADPRSIPLEPRTLTEDESFELLRKKAFPGTDQLSPDLEKIGREMVVKCGGLPLAVVVLAGLLSTKEKTVEEWRQMLKNISSRLIGEDRISAILSLSYNDLPFNLKSCFLHLGLFPEDYSIPKTKLIRLWVAEGFLPRQGEETAEDVAENSLNELIGRCLIQVGTLTSLGRVKTLRVHDLLKDLSVSKAKEENFLAIYTGHRQVESSSVALQLAKPRRFAIHASTGEYDFLTPYAPHLRSLQFFWPDNLHHPNFNCKDFKLLRVLDSPCMGAKSISRLGNLSQLRYLEMTTESGIPKSIVNLKNLQTLIVHFPSYERHTYNLRHFQATNAYRGGDLRVDTLKHLQTLKGIPGGSWIKNGDLAYLKNLRRLSIDQLKGEEVYLVISITQTFCNLQSLSLELSFSHSFPTTMRLSRFENLQKLRLKGKIEQLPDSHEFPPNLVKLTLMYSDLQPDSIVTLERLTNLKMLVLGCDSYQHEKLFLSPEAFPQLNTLHLDTLIDLEELVVEERGLRNLKNLKLTDCSRLRLMPYMFKLLITRS